MWSTAQRQKKIYRYDIHAGFELKIDQLAMATSVHWDGHVLRREDGHILRRAFYSVVVRQWKKGRPKIIINSP